MKKLFLALLIPSFAYAVQPTWEPVAYGFNGDKTAARQMYYDPLRIEVDGKIRRAWTLVDNVIGEPRYIDGKPFRSAISYGVVDCQKLRQTSLNIFFFSDNMGKGDQVHQVTIKDPEKHWRASPPGTIGDSVIEKICQTE